MWKCPNCKREFGNKNQWHSCSTAKVEDHLKGKPTSILSAFHKLESEILNWKKVQLGAVKTAVQFRIGAVFLAVSLTKTHLRLQFSIKRIIEDICIKEVIPISKERWFYTLVIQDEDDVEDLLLNWIKEAYELIRS